VTGPVLRGRGVGGRLMHTALEEFRKRDCLAVKVLVGATLEPANSYYRRHGFQLAGTLRHHDQVENMYVIDVNAARE